MIFRVIVILLFIAGIAFSYSRLVNWHSTVVDDLTTQLVSYREADSINTVRITAFSEIEKELINKNAKQGELIRQLYNTPGKDKVVFKTKTADTILIPLYIIDTLIKKDTLYKKYAYVGGWRSQWDSFSVKLDTAHKLTIDYKINNTYKVWAEDKETYTNVYVQNLNPNTITTELVAHKVPKRKPKRLLWLGGGLLGGLTLSLLR